MDFLARREHSFFELSQKLSRKFPEANLEQLLEVLSALREENLQSDERFTESYVRYRRSKGFGYLHIRADLLNRKVSESLLEVYLEANEGWCEILNTLIEKKLKAKPGQSLVYGSKEHRRLQSFLTSRGFTGEQIRKGIEDWLV
ncbi:MAG: regulatory protein RecX [Pseudohongiellaceae bacterium]